MILGMSLSTFTAVHVIISLIAIVSGIVAMFGLLASNRMPGLTAIFLLFTILTSATGFLFPFDSPGFYSSSSFTSPRSAFALSMIFSCN